MWKKLTALFMLSTVCGCVVHEAEQEPSAQETVTSEIAVVASPEPEVVQEPVVEPAAPLIPNEAWTVTASSAESDELAPAKAVDGSAVSRWASAWNDQEWWMVDFGREEPVERISLLWETAYARQYRVQISADDEVWKEVCLERNGRPGLRVIDLERQPVRRVRVECLKRGTQWGNSLLEVGFNQEKPVEAAATASSGGGDFEPANAMDGDLSTRWSSGFNDVEWWQVRLDEPSMVGGVIIHWETAFAEKFRVQLSDDGEEWVTRFEETEGDGNMDIVFFEPTSARYLRIEGFQRGTGWGYSIWEVEILKGEENPVVTASGAREGADAAKALDGDKTTQWHSAASGEQVLTVELPRFFELGGLELLWGDDHAVHYRVEARENAGWKTLVEEQSGNGATDYLYFPAIKTDAFRIVCLEDSGNGAGYALREIKCKSGGEAATPLRYYKAAALDAPEGWFPMWLRRIQEFWTIVGVPEDTEESLISETGVVEPRKGGFCVQPFVWTTNGLTTWAGVETEQSLEDGILPIPTVEWKTADWTLQMTAAAYGEAQRSMTMMRYRLINHGEQAFQGRLALAVRPVQLNPDWQRGGMSAIRKAVCRPMDQPARLITDGRVAAVSLTAPSGMGAAPIQEGDVSRWIARGEVPAAEAAEERDGMVGAALLYELNVAPGAEQDVVVVYPMHQAFEQPATALRDPGAYFTQVRDREAAQWAEKLNRFSIETGDPRLIDMMKTYLAYILLNKDDVWIKPGPRNYNHAWVRDGAITSVALLRMGIDEPVKRYVDAYSALVRDDGWAPFIILEGGHPVSFNEHGHEGQEYDSQGQYVALIRQYYDFTGDRDTAERYFGKVMAALRFAARLREERKTDEYRNDPELKPYYGILPESNSHEGYFPAKHSYWDDYWYLRGLSDGAYLAQLLGHPEELAWIETENADFRECLMNSLLAVIQRGDLSTIPGCVELADFDSTSTAIALSACDEGDFLPEPYLSNTFEAYYRDTFLKRLQPDYADTFTPYEVRTAEAFIRLGKPEKARTMLNYFTDRSSLPRNWHQLAEVVHARNRAPSYLGDMPHTWIGAEYISAVRALFAYESHGTLMLGAGIDPEWLSHGVHVSRLPTQYGLLTYSMTLEEEGTRLVFKAEGEVHPPEGFALALPQELEPSEVRINGQSVEQKDGLVRFQAFPVDITAVINPEKVKKKVMNEQQSIPPKNEWTVTASADENNRFRASFAADGRMDTRWSSPASDPQWLMLDMGRETTVCGLILHWETACSAAYRIRVSTDGKRWTTAYETDAGTGGLDDVNFRPLPARYIQLDCLKRATGWGHSLWEVDVKGLDRRPMVQAPTAPGSSTENLFDGDLKTCWTSDGSETPTLLIDWREPRAFAGLRVDWGDAYPREMVLYASNDGADWKELARMDEGTGEFDLLMHQREEARYLKLDMKNASAPDHTIQIRGIKLRGPEAVLTPLAKYQLAAVKAPAGRYPEALNGRQAYWTICGLPGDSEESLLDEYGNLEARSGGPTLMPYVLRDGRIESALDAETISQTLKDGHLPLPTVSWKLPQQLECTVEALTDGQTGDACTLVRYRLNNEGRTAVTGRFALVIRPLQINPKWQHGGLSLIRDLALSTQDGISEIIVNGVTNWLVAARADAVRVSAFNHGDVVRNLEKDLPGAAAMQDEEGLLSGALLFDFNLPPGASTDWVAVASLHIEGQAAAAVLRRMDETSPSSAFETIRTERADAWRAKISRVGFELGDRAVADTVKSQLAYILINQDGLAIQPGSRNYNRSWMRDGSITATALLRMGLVDEVRDYLNWYAASVQPDGLVPPILNTDGSVNEGFGSNLEYDSQGQFIYTVMQYYRVTQDRAFLEKHFDRLLLAMRYMQQLREKTLQEDYRADEPNRERFRGILPASISHEGYSTPSHSYWDDFWALRGWQDGAEAAEILGRTEIAEWAREQYALLRDDVAASIRSTIQTFGIDFVPGSADYGDPDATSISIAIAPCNQQDVLPEKELTRTYDLYLQEVAARGGAGASYRYTPYEVRSIPALALMGRREEAWRLHDALFADRRPAGWNHFAEVVVSEPRLGTYIGDMPHTWVGAGYLNAVRGLLLREEGDQLTLLYAVPPAWLQGDGIRLEQLPTAFGPLSLRAVYADNELTVEMDQWPEAAQTVRLNWPRNRAPDEVWVDGKMLSAIAAGGMAVPVGAKKIQAVWSTTEMTDQQTAQLLRWMRTNQDTSSPEKQLLADTLGGDIAQTFNNALAAMAFIATGEEERAARILDFFRDATVKDNEDQFLQNLYYNGEARGFFQNAWLTEGPDRKRLHCAKDSDRWMGDMAWLIFACKQFDARFNTDRYEGLVQQLFDLLKSWYVPQGPGGYFAHGWRKSDRYLHEDHGHHEGNIDAYAVCRMMGDLETAEKIAAWLEPQLNRNDLPLDLYTWRVLAFAPEDAEVLNVLETVPGYKKALIFHDRKVVGFTAFITSDENIWSDGLGHISCAYHAVDNSEKARYYLEQLGLLIIPEAFNGETEYGIPFTARNTPGYEWVNTRQGFVSCAAWYLMAAQGFNPMQLTE